MIEYALIKPTVYVETSVISYLTSLPSRDSFIFSRQEATRRLWDQYFDSFEFIVSESVVNEIKQGDVIEAQKRLKTVEYLTTLETSQAIDKLAQLLIDSGAVPPKSRSDAQHISIATVHNLDYLISWNFKHIVNELKQQHIYRVCRSAGYTPVNLCTPLDLIEEIQMKEKLDTKTDPILEECYRMKEEFNAQFNSMEELSAYLMEIEKQEKARGKKYRPAPPPPPDFEKNIKKMYKELAIKRKQEGKDPDQSL